MIRMIVDDCDSDDDDRGDVDEYDIDNNKMIIMFYPLLDMLMVQYYYLSYGYDDGSYGYDGMMIVLYSSSMWDSMT